MQNKFWIDQLVAGWNQSLLVCAGQCGETWPVALALISHMKQHSLLLKKTSVHVGENICKL